MFYYFLGICFFYLLLIILFLRKNLAEILVFMFTVFFGVNSIYFSIVYFFDFILDLRLLLLVNIFFVLILLFFAKKYDILHIKFGEKIIKGKYLAVLFVTLISFLAIFLSNTRSINNDFRLPIPSYTEDASQHFNYVLKPFLTNNFVAGNYPYSFHGNAWLLIKLATQITGKVDDFVFITNIFSLYIWLILFLTLSLISMIVSDLVSIKKKSLFWQLIITFSSLFIGSVVSFYFVEYGFFSNWFNQLFSLAIVYLISKNDRKLFIFLIPLTFGFFYSYSFFMPVLVVFYGYFVFIKRRKDFLTLFLLSLLLSLFYFVKLLLSFSSVTYLITVGGGFPAYPIAMLLLYISFSFFYLLKNKDNKSKISEYLSVFGFIFLLYSLVFAVLQLLLNGAISYSFHKIFASVILILGIFAAAGFVVFFKSFFEKGTGLTSMSLFIKSVVLILVFAVISNYESINPPLFSIFKGHGNFFSNNKEKYNGVIYALENFSNYKNVIYVDGDYQSTRWATLSYLRVKFNVIYDLEHVTDFMNYDYYISQLNQLNSDTLILNPARVLEYDCDADGLIKAATQSANKVLIYPPFDWDKFRLNCNDNSVRQKDLI